LSETFFIPKITERDKTKKIYWSSCKVTVILVRFLLDSNFLDRFSKNTQMSNFMATRPMGVELFQAEERTDGRTVMTELTVAFRNSANASKKPQAITNNSNIQGHQKRWTGI
jgi:hypothetical protein